MGLSLFLYIFIPAAAFAHQPRVVNSDFVNVVAPEVSKAYYGQLSGQSQIFQILADKSFSLYVNILVPDIAGQKKDVSAGIYKDGDAKPLAVLGGINSEWKKFYEPFGRDTYWQGSEYKVSAAAGKYEIRVFSVNNDSKYALAIGERELFDLKESVNAVSLIPKLKRVFFNESPARFILSPFGIGYVVVLFALSFIFGFVYRLILKRFATGTVRGLHKNIGFKDRWLRFAFAVGLLLLAITTSWNPIILFASGFCFFEAIFSWCGFYAAIGKNSCPIN